MNFQQLRELIDIDSGEQRPIRLRFSPQHAHLSELLIVKRMEGCASICGSLEYQLICISIRSGLPLADFLAVPIEVQLVTDRGRLSSVCGIIDSAAEGLCDGGFASATLNCLVQIAAGMSWSQK